MTKYTPKVITPLKSKFELKTSEISHNCQEFYEFQVLEKTSCGDIIDPKWLSLEAKIIFPDEGSSTSSIEKLKIELDYEIFQRFMKRLTLNLNTLNNIADFNYEMYFTLADSLNQDDQVKLEKILKKMEKLKLQSELKDTQIKNISARNTKLKTDMDHLIDKMIILKKETSKIPKFERILKNVTETLNDQQATRKDLSKDLNLVWGKIQQFGMNIIGLHSSITPKLYKNVTKFYDSIKIFDEMTNSLIGQYSDLNKLEVSPRMHSMVKELKTMLEYHETKSEIDSFVRNLENAENLKNSINQVKGVSPGPKKRVLQEEQLIQSHSGSQESSSQKMRSVRIESQQERKISSFFDKQKAVEGNFEKVPPLSPWSGAKPVDFGRFR